MKLSQYPTSQYFNFSFVILLNLLRVRCHRASVGVSTSDRSSFDCIVFQTSSTMQLNGSGLMHDVHIHVYIFGGLVQFEA